MKKRAETSNAQDKDEQGPTQTNDRLADLICVNIHVD